MTGRKTGSPALRTVSKVPLKKISKSGSVEKKQAKNLRGNLPLITLGDIRAVSLRRRYSCDSGGVKDLRR